MDFVSIPAWKQFRWLQHGFSRRGGGISTVYGGASLNLGWTKEDDPAFVAENRGRFVSAVTGGTPSQHAVTLRQVHATDIQVLREGCDSFEDAEGRALLEGDGLVTKQPGKILGIQTADCVPVIIIDPKKHAIGVFHAGWRGTAAGITEVGVATFAAEYGSRPEDLLAAVGPSIGVCCYTVGDEVRMAFQRRFSYADRLFDGDRLDLWEANRRQLVDVGLVSAKVTVVGECTGCARDATGERRYFSHRIDQGVTGRMMTLVGITSAT